MKNTIIDNNLSMEEKLSILSDAAKYDVACTSSGVDRSGSKDGIGSAKGAGICHSFTADGRCISLLKILFTNECIYDCKYCINRSSNDVVRTSFTPDEVCNLTMQFYRRNYIEGLFLSSGIINSPNYTMGLLYETIYKLRMEYNFHGYIHVKGIPGADAEVIENMGYIVDRMSINLELPTKDGLKDLAPHKNRHNILSPIKVIQTGIHNNRYLNGVDNKYQRLNMKNYNYEEIRNDKLLINNSSPKEIELKRDFSGNEIISTSNVSILGTKKKFFVPAGQSTQMIIGATKESDYHIINVAEALYDNYNMKRVFYSAFINVNNDSKFSDIKNVPLLREHRIYQADFLLRFYGFKANELLTEEKPFFNELIDPKCNWAVNNLDIFPVEINRADYLTLLRVPGIGVKSAKRIVEARKYGELDFENLKKIGVVLKRALYFITCKGKMMYSTKLESDYITNHLIYNDPPQKLRIMNKEFEYSQMNLFDYLKGSGGIKAIGD
jgi:putative DNA modification/repair radical SAM protein